MLQIPKGASIICEAIKSVPNPWTELEHIGERIIEAQAAETEAWNLYTASPTEALLERWRFARDEVNQLVKQREKLIRGQAS